MSEEFLLSAIEEEALGEAEAILRQAREDARKILEEAKEQAEGLESSLIRQRESEFRKRKTRLETQRLLELRHSVTRLKAKAVEEALDQAKEKFQALRQGPGYEPLFKKLLKELVDAVDEARGALLVRVRAGDEKVASLATKELGLQAEIVADTSIDGGVELLEKEGEFRLRNTFDTRVSRIRDKLIQRLNELLFHDV